MKKTKKEVKIKEKTMVHHKLALGVLVISSLMFLYFFIPGVLKLAKRSVYHNKQTINLQAEQQSNALEFCDHNYDGKITLADIALFESCKDSFDANDDGVHNLTDIGLYSQYHNDTTWCRRWLPECEAKDVGISFGLNTTMNSREVIDYSLGVMNDLGIDKTRIWENWILREPVKGEYDWSGLDIRINSFYDAGKTFVLTIKPVGVKGNELSWYCQPAGANINSCVFNQENENDFAKYIKAIFERYPGKIDKIQFSNEWDSDYQFVGTAQEYVRYANILYDTVKKYSPNTLVSLGSITKWPLVYTAACELDLIDEFYYNGSLVTDKQRTTWCNSDDILAKDKRVSYVFANAKYDLVDIHLYDDPENWNYYVQALQKFVGKKQVPIIVTEFGGPDSSESRFDPTDESVQANELRRYMDAIIQLPIMEAYYFRMIEGGGEGIGHPLTGLMKMDGNLPVKKLNYDVFKTYSK